MRSTVLDTSLSKMRRHFSTCLRAALEKGGWEEAWASQTTPWEAARPSPYLKHILSLKQFPLNSKALIPGCGSGHDTLAFATSGLCSSVVGLDLSKTALTHATKIAGGNECVKLIQGDFFSHIGSYNLIWDYTFLAALPLSLRPQYAQHTYKLLSSMGGSLHMVLFPVDASIKTGPPFHMDPEEIDALLTAAGFAKTRGLEAIPNHLSFKGRQGREVYGCWEANTSL